MGTVRRNVTIDRTLRENVRAYLRSRVRRILRKAWLSVGQAGEGDADSVGADGGAVGGDGRWVEGVLDSTKLPYAVRQFMDRFIRHLEGQSQFLVHLPLERFLF